jgi:hypothetical protein
MPDGVALRGSARSELVLTFSLDEWRAFVRGVAHGEFTPAPDGAVDPA